MKRSMTRLRDRAIAVLSASSPLLTGAVLRRMRCHQVLQRAGDGALFLRLDSRHTVFLSQQAQRTLLEWMEARRGWGQPERTLFPGVSGEGPLSLRGVLKALERGRERLA